MAYQSKATTENDGPVKQRYLRYSSAREPYLEIARKCAALTIPRLIPPKGKSKAAKFKTPHQSVGSRGVNTLANKITMALFPPNTPFFRMSIGQFDLHRMILENVLAANEGISLEDAEQAIQEEMAGVNRNLDAKLSTVENAVMRQFETQKNRATDAEAVKHLIVAGNALRKVPQEEDEEPRIYTLPNYVTKRDPDGTVLEMITREGVSPLSLDPEIRITCKIEMDENAYEREFDLYTHIRRAYDERGPYWAASQELNGFLVPGSEGEYEIDNCPWIPLRWTKVDGEDYGRGHVEEYLGALVSLEGLSEALLHSAIASSRTLVFVDPNSSSGTKIKDVAGAPNGKVVPGKADDVTFLQSNKYHDLRTPAEQVAKLAQDLNYAFLVTTAIQRDAERVTSTEIRMMAQELESALGGVYTTLGHEYQRPLVVSTIKSLQKNGSIPELPPDVEPIVITGMDALGRNTEATKLMELLDSFKLILQQDEVGIRLDVRGIMNRLAASKGINMEGILLPEEVVMQLKQQQAEQAQQQMMMEMANRLGPQAIKAGTEMATQQQ